MTAPRLIRKEEFAKPRHNKRLLEMKLPDGTICYIEQTGAFFSDNINVYIKNKEGKFLEVDKTSSIYKNVQETRKKNAEANEQYLREHPHRRIRSWGSTEPDALEKFVGKAFFGYKDPPKKTVVVKKLKTTLGSAKKEDVLKKVSNSTLNSQDNKQEQVQFNNVLSDSTQLNLNTSTRQENDIILKKNMASTQYGNWRYDANSRNSGTNGYDYLGHKGKTAVYQRDGKHYIRDALGNYVRVSLTTDDVTLIRRLRGDNNKMTELTVNRVIKSDGGNTGNVDLTVHVTLNGTYEDPRNVDLAYRLRRAADAQARAGRTTLEADARVAELNAETEKLKKQLQELRRGSGSVRSTGNSRYNEDTYNKLLFMLAWNEAHPDSQLDYGQNIFRDANGKLNGLDGIAGKYFNTAWGTEGVADAYDAYNTWSADNNNGDYSQFFALYNPDATPEEDLEVGLEDVIPVTHPTAAAADKLTKSIIANRGNRKYLGVLGSLYDASLDGGSIYSETNPNGYYYGVNMPINGLMNLNDAVLSAYASRYGKNSHRYKLLNKRLINGDMSSRYWGKVLSRLGDNMALQNRLLSLGYAPTKMDGNSGIPVTNTTVTKTAVTDPVEDDFDYEPLFEDNDFQYEDKSKYDEDNWDTGYDGII